MKFRRSVCGRPHLRPVLPVASRLTVEPDVDGLQQSRPVFACQRLRNGHTAAMLSLDGRCAARRKSQLLIDQIAQRLAGEIAPQIIAKEIGHLIDAQAALPCRRAG